MDFKPKFKVYCSTDLGKITKGFLTSLEEEQSPLTLEAVISTTSVDLDGDYMTQSCIESMKKQVLGLSVFLDHQHTVDKIIGKVTHLYETNSDSIKVKFEIIPSYSWYILEFIEAGINLGTSIGATVTDFEETEKGWAINDVILHEFSIVGIPANPDTLGTVNIAKGLVTANCVNGACKQIIDNLDSSLFIKELEDGSDVDDEVVTRQEVVNLINESWVEGEDRIITRIVNEYLENPNLQNQPSPTSDDDKTDKVDDSDVKDDKTDSSTDEDKEKSLDMDKEEIVELVKNTIMTTLKEFKEAEEETPESEEEEVETDATEEKGKEITVKIDADDLVEELKSIREEIDIKLNEIAKTKEEIDVRLKEFEIEAKESIEAEVLKGLSVGRKPEETPQPPVVKEEKEMEVKSNKMNSGDLAKFLYENGL